MKIFEVNQFITDMTIAAKSADQKSFTSRTSLTRAVRANIAALTTTRKKPSEMMTAGRVKNFTSEPIVTLIAPKRSATQK